MFRDWGGKKVGIVNASHWISEIGNRLAPHCDFAVIWYFDHEDQRTKASLRAFHDNVDVSEIAKVFGGGGHTKSAGFIIDKSKHIDDIFHPLKPKPVARRAPRKKKNETKTTET